ncbi:phosphatidylserine decarboxylase [bacterium]|nr:phosphatidylserine decarboxylase [bacterium]
MIIQRIHHLISRTTGIVARSRMPRAFVQVGIRWLVKTYGINLSEAREPVHHFATLDAFFTRELKPECRPIASGVVAVSPADGVVIQRGLIEDGALIQAKGRHYSVTELLGATLGPDFQQGSFATIYLSPKDCHRLFCPADSAVLVTRYVPGCLYPVRQKQLDRIPHLYCRNERLISILQTPSGKMAMVAVGALNVGSISTTYDSDFNGGYDTVDRVRHYVDLPVLKAGQWMGTFHLGSTVVLIHERQVTLPELGAIQYGQGLFR